MVTPLKFEDLVSAGVGTGEPHRIHIGLTARRNIANLLGTGDGPTDLLGKCDSAFVIGEEGGSL